MSTMNLFFWTAPKGYDGNIKLNLCTVYTTYDYAKFRHKNIYKSIEKKIIKGYFNRKTIHKTINKIKAQF